jgi:hypothetical protein
LQVSKRIAIHGLNVSMAVFIAISAYGLLGYFGIGVAPAQMDTPRTAILFAAAIAASIAGIGWFGMHLDRSKAKERADEARQQAEEAARKAKRKPTRRKAD